MTVAKTRTAKAKPKVPATPHKALTKAIIEHLSQPGVITHETYESAAEDLEDDDPANIYFNGTERQVIVRIRPDGKSYLVDIRVTPSTIEGWASNLPRNVDLSFHDPVEELVELLQRAASVAQGIQRTVEGYWKNFHRRKSQTRPRSRR